MTRGFLLGIGILLLSGAYASAQSTGDFQAHRTGIWSDSTAWEMWNGSTWVTPAPGAPTNSSGVITIPAGDTITVSSNVSADQVVVAPGGQITINAGDTLTVANGTGTDLTVSGVLSNAGRLTVNAGAAIAVSAGGIYQHAQNGGTIPTAAWNAGSTCIVTGTVATLPGGLNQSFGNLTWNCTGQTAATTFANTLSIAGSLAVQSTGGTGQFRFASGTNTIAGSFTQSGGRVRVSGGSNRTITVSGSFTMTGGTLEIADNTGIGTLNIGGDFSQTGGTITESGTSTTSGIVFTGAATHAYTSGGTITNTINFTVSNGSTLQVNSGSTFLINSTASLTMGTGLVNGPGNFTLSSGATLSLGSPAGISAASASGNIQAGGTRSFSTGAKYVYNGSSAQNAGDGLPASVNSLTVNNAAGLSLQADVTVAGTLTMTAGSITTGANTMTLGTGTASTGTLTRTTGTIIGNLKRWLAASTVANLLFPVGTSANYRPANVSYTAALSTGGTITSSFVAADPGSGGLPLNDAGTNVVSAGKDGYWNLSPGDGLSGGTISLDLTADAFGGVSNFSTLRILERATGASPWLLDGTFSAGTGSNTTPVAHRTGMSGLGQFGIGGGTDNPLPIQLAAFNIAAVDHQMIRLDWTTESEVNNFGFTVERRASSQQVFAAVPGSFSPGHGTSSVPQRYAFIDSSAGPGIWYYRLLQTDMDGSIHLSDVVQVEVNAGAGIDGSVPPRSSLDQNYPNPFNPSTDFRFTVARPGRAEVRLYDALGREIARLYDGPAQPGQSYAVSVNGSRLASGVYFYRLSSGGSVLTKKMLLTK